jgi:parvulin-like peptidyl-prolyl isomerase
MHAYQQNLFYMIKGKAAQPAWIVLPAVLLFVFFGCSGKEGKTPSAQKDVAEAQGKVVARVGNSMIETDELKAYLEDRPVGVHSRDMRTAIDGRLEELITAEVLYQEALRLKLDQKPQIRHSIRQILGQALIEQQVNRARLAKKISEQDVKAFYDEHIDRYQRPDQVRLAHIYIAVPEDATSAQREAKRAHAGKVLQEVLAKKSSRFGFGALIRKYSDTHPNFKHGDTGYFGRDGKPAGVDKKIAEAGFGLEKNGAIADHVIETEGGFHIIMRVSKRAAFSSSLGSVKQQIRQQILRQSLKEKREGYIGELRKNASVSMDEKTIAAVLQTLEKGGRNAAERSSRTPPAMPVPGATPQPMPGKQK